MISAEEFLAQQGIRRDADAAVEQSHTHYDQRDSDNTAVSAARQLRRSAPSRRNARRQTQSESTQPVQRTRGSFSVTQTQTPTDTEACKEAALRLLDAAARSTGSLAKKLKERGYADETIDAVIARLVELQLLDDEAYAQSVIRACVHREMGERGAVMELTRKGVDRALAQHMAQEAAQEGVFEEAAWQLGRTVARKTRGLEPQVRRRRFWSAGGRKGHDTQILREVCEELFPLHPEDEYFD